MRILSFIVLICFHWSAKAQIATDTLSEFFNFPTAQLIPSPNGGYVSGTNGYLDSEKLQAFFPSKPYSVLGAWIWIGTKTIPPSVIASTCLKLRKLDPTPTDTPPYVNGIKSTIDSAFFDLSTLNASMNMTLGMNWMPFSQPVLVNTPFVIGLTFDSSALIDSLRPEYAIMHSADDSVKIPGRSWECWNGVFKRIIDSWELSIDLAVFPVIDTSLTSISNLLTVKPELFPNPADQEITLLFNQEREFNKLTVFDGSGRSVLTINVPADESSFSLDISKFTTGNYLILCEGSNTRGYASFIVSR